MTRRKVGLGVWKRRGPVPAECAVAMKAAQGAVDAAAQANANANKARLTADEVCTPPRPKAPPGVTVPKGWTAMMTGRNLRGNTKRR